MNDKLLMDAEDAEPENTKEEAKPEWLVNVDEGAVVDTSGWEKGEDGMPCPGWCVGNNSNAGQTCTRVPG